VCSGSRADTGSFDDYIVVAMAAVAFAGSVEHLDAGVDLSWSLVDIDSSAFSRFVGVLATLSRVILSDEHRTDAVIVADDVAAVAARAESSDCNFECFASLSSLIERSSFHSKFSIQFLHSSRFHDLRNEKEATVIHLAGQGLLGAHLSLKTLM
jgi:hypothetical protein